MQSAGIPKNLMCPFQCDLCHFRNIQKREPLLGHRKDILLLQCIRRVSLDAFWVWEPSIVRANLQEAKSLEEIVDTFGMRAGVPASGGVVLRGGHIWNGADGVVHSDLLMDKGETEEFVQFSTARGLRSVYSNIVHASSQQQMGLAVMAQNTTRIWVTTCPLTSMVIVLRDLCRACTRGWERKSDLTLLCPSQTVPHSTLGHLDKEWMEARTPLVRQAVVEMFLVTGFDLRLRGKEVVKMDIEGIMK
jgi:hypothetical protein